MRKGIIVAISVFSATLLLALSLFGTPHVSAQQETATPTGTAECNPQAELDSLSFTANQANGDTAHDLGLLKQVRDEIDAQIATCGNEPTATLTASETKVGTLTVNDARTATRAAVNDIRTATSSVKTATASFIAAYKTIARGELASYADKHVGEKVKVQGRVFNILDDQTLQIFLSDGITPIYVDSTLPFSGIYENDNVTIYGAIVGYKDGSNTSGGTIHQPWITADLIVKN